MGSSVHAGYFAMNTGTGSQTISNPGFRPKVVIFFPTNRTSVASIGADAHFAVGAMDDAGNQRAMDCNSENGEGTSDAHRKQKNNKCIAIYDAGTGTIDCEAQYNGMTDTGFTIDITNAPSSGYRVAYVAIGGDDHTDVKVGDFELENSVTEQSVTGVGFQPDMVLFFAPPGVDYSTSSVNSKGTIGFAVNASQQGALGVASENGKGTSQTTRIQSTSRCIHSLHADGSAVQSSAAFLTMESDGFDIDVLTAPASKQDINYIAIKGGQFNVKSFNTHTSAEQFSETGVGFEGTGLLLASFCNPTSASIEDDNNVVIGAASSPSEEFSVGSFDEDGQGTTDADTHIAARIFRQYTFSRGADASMQFISFDADGWTLDETNGTSAAYEILALTIGPAAEPAAGNPWYTYANQ